MSTLVSQFKSDDFGRGSSSVRSAISRVSIVRILPSSGPQKGDYGTGFILQQYPNLIITARHVIWGAESGSITTRMGGQNVPIDFDMNEWSITANKSADVAVIRVGSRFTSKFEKGSLMDDGSNPRVEIKGYGVDAITAEVVGRSNEWIYLSQTAPTGVSGAPVYIKNGDEYLVVGVFVSDDSSWPGAKSRACAIDAPALRACINELK